MRYTNGDNMPRPKKVKTDVMDGTAMIEVKDEGKTYVAEPEIVATKPVEDKVPELVAEVVKPKVAEPDKTKMPPPIYDIEGLDDEDRQLLIEKKIKSIISQTTIPYIPFFVKFKEPGTTAVPPMYAIVDFDHRFVDEGWKFYQTNVREPYMKDYLNLVTKVMNKPNRVFTRVVYFDYE